MNRLIPGITMKDTTIPTYSKTEKLKRNVEIHKWCVETVNAIFNFLQNQSMKVNDKGHFQLVSGLLQLLCLKVPQITEERSYVAACVTAIFAANEKKLQCSLHFIRFIDSFSRSAKPLFRQFAVDLFTRFLLETECWNIAPDDTVPSELTKFSGIYPLIQVLIERSSDRIANVRVKAISGLSAVLLRGLHDDAEKDASPQSYAVQQTFGSYLKQILLPNDVSEVALDNNLLHRLLALFRERLTDEKTFVRRAAIQAMETIILLDREDVREFMLDDISFIHARCADSSIIVRNQAIKTLSTVLLKYPNIEKIQQIWNIGVLPLAVDPEQSVQVSHDVNKSFTTFF